MPGYEGPNNQPDGRYNPYAGQNHAPHETLPPYGMPQQGSGTYPPVNQDAPPPYGMPQQGSGTYPPVNQPSGAYGMPQQGSGTYPPVNQPSGAYGMPQQGSGTYPPVNQPSGAYQPQEAAQSPEGWPGAREDMPAADPFDETGFDPSLRDMRATQMFSDKNPFWEDFSKQKKRQDKQAKQAEKEQKKAAKAARRAQAGSHAGRNVLITLCVLAAVAFALYTSLYRVREIEVRGDLYTFTQAEVAKIAGIEYMQSMADVDEDDVAAHVASNRYLIFRAVETIPLSKVILTVKERQPAAVLTYSGTRYLIDHRGMVLEESPSDVQMKGLPVISGIQVKGNYGCMVGSILKTEQSAQFDTLCSLLLELKVQSAENTVTTINLANLENILMETVVGYGVSLGDSTHIHGKVKAMLYVMGSLAEQGLGPGTIDVSNRTAPTYIPD